MNITKFIKSMEGLCWRMVRKMGTDQKVIRNSLKSATR